MFLPALEAWLKECSPEKQPALFRAISSIRSRAAAVLLLSYAGPSATAENREIIFQALARQTGKVELGSDREAWKKWLASVAPLSEEEWETVLAASLAARIESLRVQRDDIVRRLVEAERARFLEATTDQSRAVVLCSLLRDELPVLRRLGIELVNRELANARQLDSSVGVAALDLLKDPAADVRSAGADLVDRLLPTGAAIAVRDALARERDPNVLAKMLRLARRFPTVAPPDMLVGWLGADTAVRRAAIDAIAALQQAGLLAAPIDTDRALETLRSEKPEDLSIDGLKLLCELGSEKDRDAVALMLASTSAETRARAAQALAPFSERLPVILAAARTDPSLFSVAALAITQHHANLAGYHELLSLPAPTPAAMREAVSALCQALPIADLVSAARDTEDLDIREALLSRVIDLTAPSPNSTHGGPFEGSGGKALVDALMLLARTQLELKKPAAALSTLDLVTPAGPSAVAAGVPLRVRALLALDRLDDAIALDASADSWLDGLADAVELPHALAIAAEIKVRFDTVLTPVQRARLEELTVRASKSPASTGDESASTR